LLISTVTFDTPENKRSEMTLRTYESLLKTVDFNRHRLIISDNGSTDPATIEFLSEIKDHSVTVIYNHKNIGTATGINQAWKMRKPGEHACKIDNDVVVHQSGWADLAEEVFSRDPRYGLIGLKRKDLEQRPDHNVPHFRSSLVMIPHKPGEKWIVIEETQDIMGTCTFFSSALLDKIGYLYQGGWKYGFEDAYVCHRTHIAGFKTGFINGIEIDHIDTGDNQAYLKWKQDYAFVNFPTYRQWVSELSEGKRPIYHGPDDI
jgi:GT2 family glycosyltransferase